MGRYLYTTYDKSPTPRYLGLFGLQWQVLQRLRLEAGVDLRSAMAAAIRQLHSEGWEAESAADYGFVFVHRGPERRLLMLTSRDPLDRRAQSFDPFSRLR